MKILKVTLYKNFSLSQAGDSEVEEKCPITKYLEKDDKYEINQSDFQFKGKNKKNIVEKEQLVFSKKKKDHGQKATMY